MHRSLSSFIIMAVAALMIIGGAVGISFAAHATADQRTPITGQTVPLLKHAQFVSATAGQQQIDLSIGLKLRNAQELDTLLGAMYNAKSPLYHHFLTPQQFAAEFGPTTDQQQQVVSYLQGQGITVTHVASNGLLIDARANIATVESAFGVKINNYQIGARKFYANATAPTVPSALSTLILSIGGLDNSVKLRPLGAVTPHATTTHTAQPLAGYAPTDLNGAYDATALHQGGIQGSNQTVAVFELDGFQQSDIDQYLKSNNLGTPSISTQLVDGATQTAGAGAIEVELDIEVVAAMAPKASQVVYIGPNTTQGVNDTYNQIVTDNKAQITTTSWGECETQSGNAELQALDNIFKQGSAQGLTIFAAAGDSGAYDCNDTNLAVDSPASDPYVTGVGGTNLQTSGGTYGSESVWSNPTDTQRSPNGSGGGGGLSSLFAQPSWQTGPGVQNQYSNGEREVPDVAADADPQTGYAIYCTVSAAGCPSTGNVVVGGTSAAAPLWAGSTALINEYLQQQGKTQTGFISPTLYGLASAQQQYAPFHDVSSGTNLFYPATANYDEATGLGSPDIYNIARDLAGGSVPTPTPTPAPPVPTVTATATVIPTPVPTATSTPVTAGPSPTATPQPPVSNSLLQNGDFENGVTPWQESSAGGYELIDTTNAHGGQYGAYLCGYSSCNDVISQSFVVPASTSHLALSYWLDVRTHRTTTACRDTLNVMLLNSHGKVIGKMQPACNTSATGQWQQATTNVAFSQYAGQTVTLVFSGRTTTSQATTAFFIDDVAVMAL
jgi:Pro-kumamolisin, activation domain